MKINIAEAVKNEGEVFQGEYTGPVKSVEYLGETYAFNEGAAVRADYFFDGEGIVVTGSLQAEAQVHCARCLKPLQYCIETAFTETYRKHPEEGEYAFTGETIDLTGMLEDNIVLSLPQRHLCSEDCKGLCARCGVDLNTGQCECKDEIDESNPFYGLSKLNQDEEV